MRELLLYKLTLKAQKMLAVSRASRREVMRRMKTSPTQFYRLIDQTNYRKTIDQMIKLLSALDCSVDLVLKRLRTDDGNPAEGFAQGCHRVCEIMLDVHNV